MTVAVHAGDFLVVTPFEVLDIGGTNTSSADGGDGTTLHWQSMRDWKKAFVFVSIGPTWNAADAYDTFKLQQATATAGTGVKDITGKAATANTGTAEERLVFHLDASEMDVANGFDFFRFYGEEDDNTGVDQVCVTYVMYEPRFSRDDQETATEALN